VAGALGTQIDRSIVSRPAAVLCFESAADPDDEEPEPAALLLSDAF